MRVDSRYRSNRSTAHAWAVHSPSVQASHSSLHTVRGDRALEVLSFTVDVLPGTIWLHITSQAGMSVLGEWLRSQSAPVVVHRPDAFDEVAVGISVVVEHLVANWFVIDQLGGRRHE